MILSLKWRGRKIKYKANLTILDATEFINSKFYKKRTSTYIPDFCVNGNDDISFRRFSVRFDLLKGHGNVADFLGFLQKSVRHRFLTLHFEPFRVGLRIPGDIRNRKTTPRLAKSGSRQECL